jgi:GAF domain-containing protein
VTESAGGREAWGIAPAVEELARLILVEESPGSVLERLIELVKQVIPAGAAASITVVHKKATTAAFTGKLALRLDEAQYRDGHGPCMDAALSGQFMEITDGRIEDRWPDYIPTFLRLGALSSLAVPVPAVQAAASLNVYSTLAGAFSDQDRQAATEIATYAGVALANIYALQDAREQTEQMRTAMASRAAIEQAKGILVERYKISPEQAFRLLAETSTRSNRRVRDLAEHLVRTGELQA